MVWTIAQNGQSNTPKNACIGQESGAAVAFFTPDIEKMTRTESVLFGESISSTDSFTKTETVVITNV